MAQAITPELRAELAQALCDVREQALAARDLPDYEGGPFDQMFDKVAAFMRLAGGGWPEEDRTDFIGQATADLADIPATLLGPALDKARQKVRWPREYVPWIRDEVEDQWARLKADQQIIERLAEIAGEIAQ